jgi:hypothetical protein
VRGLAVSLREKRVEEVAYLMLPLRVWWPDSALVMALSRATSNGGGRLRSKRSRAKRNEEESDWGEEREPSG